MYNVCVFCFKDYKQEIFAVYNQVDNSSLNVRFLFYKIKAQVDIYIHIYINYNYKIYKSEKNNNFIYFHIINEREFILYIIYKLE